jgi:hypothetical protein
MLMAKSVWQAAGWKMTRERNNSPDIKIGPREVGCENAY